ncbi:hypothetical protein PROFUN_16647, partial [Planoprotostelium fungivorum]
GLFEKELASYNNKKQCMKMNNKRYEERLQDLIEEKENEYKAEMKRVQIECKNKTMSLELQLEEMQENKIEFIRKQMIVIQAFNERFHQLDQTERGTKQTTEQRPEKKPDLLNMDGNDVTRAMTCKVWFAGRCKFRKQKFSRNSPASPDALAEGIWRREMNVLNQDKKVQDEAFWGDEEFEECPHDDLMAEAEEEGFSNYRILHRQPRTMAETLREQMSYTTQTGSAGQQACLRDEGLSTSNITPAFLDAAKDILKNN